MLMYRDVSIENEIKNEIIVSRLSHMRLYAFKYIYIYKKKERASTHQLDVALAVGLSFRISFAAQLANCLVL